MLRNLPTFMQLGLLTLFTSCLASPAISDQDKANQQGKNLAKEINSDINNMINDKALQNIPYFEGTNVPQTNLHLHPDIEGYAQGESLNNDVANEIKAGYQNRPKFNLDPNTDPLFKRLEGNQEQANSLTDNYQGCVNVAVGSDDIVNQWDESCSTKGWDTFEHYHCDTKWLGSCTNQAELGARSKSVTAHFGMVGHNKYVRSYRVSGRYEGHRYPIMLDVTIHFGGNRINQNNIMGRYDGGAEARTEFHGNGGGLSAICRDSQYEVLSLSVKDQGTWSGLKPALGINGRQIYNSGSWSYQMLSPPSCENGLMGRFRLIGNGHGTKYRKKRWFRYKYYVREPFYDLMSRTIKLTMHYKKRCNARVDKQARVCYGDEKANGIAKKYISSQTACLDNKDKIIEGVTVSSPCWLERTTYTIRHRHFKEDSYCQTLRNKGCAIKSSHCVTPNTPHQNECNLEKHIYQCSTSTPAKTTSVCAEELYCPDGDCTKEIGKEPPSDDFAETASYLSMVQELSTDLTEHNNIKIFTGQSQGCYEDSFILHNCCVKKPSELHPIAMLNCSQNDKKLAAAREAGKTHYVGNYCSRKFLFFGCNRKSHVYCVYPSKLARIMIVQGKKQIGLNHGSPKYPNCRGLKVHELELIDFSKVDLSEYFNDVEQKHGKISESEKAQIVEDIKRRFGQNRNKNNPNLGGK